jgi:hypothetical protein
MSSWTGVGSICPLGRQGVPRRLAGVSGLDRHRELEATPALTNVERSKPTLLFAARGGPLCGKCLKGMRTSQIGRSATVGGRPNADAHDRPLSEGAYADPHKTTISSREWSGTCPAAMG